jgi:hypothetical protein
MVTGRGYFPVGERGHQWLLRLPCGPVFDASERGAKHGRACGLAPVAAAGAIRSSEPLQSVRLVTRPRLTAMAGAAHGAGVHGQADRTATRR